MAEIRYQDSSLPMFYHEVGNKIYSFAVKDMLPGSHEFFCKMMSESLDEAYRRGQLNGINIVRNQIRDALGIEE